MKKSFFALMLAAVLPAANAASGTERDVQISALTAEQARLGAGQAGTELLIDEQNRKIKALEARISKLEKRLSKSK
jgi:putative response regulator frzS